MRLHQIITEATMRLERERFEHLLTPAVRALDAAARKAGYEVRIVGGAVRDLVMGKDPKDIDMATDAVPEAMMQVLDAAGIRHEPTGLQHGTITAILDGEPIEITTLRIDTETDGRHAEVEFTNDWRKDAERRDLTFNAMSMELDGTLHDYFDGVEDLQNGVARFVGNADARMQEDFLRILRFFRFQGRLDNPQWDPETMAAVARNAGGLEGISGERIWMEMEKILARPSRAAVLKRMDDTDVLEAIDMPVNRISFVDRVDGDDPVAALAAAVNTVGGLETLRNKWKFSNEVFTKARFILEYRDADLEENDLKAMLADPKVRNEHVIALLNSVGRGEMVNKLRAWQPPEFPLSGSDLIAAGMKPGPEMGRQLAQLRREWEQSGFRLNRNQLLKMAQ
jgi:tRNA nucleotidyltransferase (CCA-adding enzyme)